ncbi:cytochrome c maturation protein CcmE [SAR202 cluster bacterium AC-409-J13_OGT_754m]|nr:cytochrome c maturation protein CcmE [SAR202 cluster bacterium AC-409-J13_OGT_754m]
MLESNTEELHHSFGAGRGSVAGRKRFVFVIGVLILAIIYLIFAAFPSNTNYYLTVDELTSYEGSINDKTFMVRGNLVEGTFSRFEGTTMATFRISHGGETVSARYDGIVPDLFFNPHSEVILKGKFDDVGVFDTDTVSVLCPTKYEALGDLET